MKTSNKIKLGLVGTLLAGATILFSGCSSTPKFPPLSNNYGLNLAKTNIGYESNINKANQKAIQDFTSVLNTQTKGLFKQADKDGLDRLKKAYESEEKAREQRAKVSGDYNPSANVSAGESQEQEGYIVNAGLYGFQRIQNKGEDYPKDVNGVGAKITFPMAGRLGAYGKFEVDEKYREVNVQGTGSLDLTSTGQTFGAGLNYDAVKNEWVRVGVDAGLFKRMEENRINGVVGISPIREEDKTSYLGAEAGVNATIYLGENIGLTGSFSYENHNLTGSEDRNTSTSYTGAIGIEFKFGGK